MKIFQNIVWRPLLSAAAGLSLCALLPVSCVKEDVGRPEGANAGLPEITACLTESVPATKTLVDGDLNVLWEAGDEISVFLKSSTNLEYALTGDGGSPAGNFRYVSGSASGLPVNFNYGVYPYRKDNRIGSDQRLQVTVPAVQPYAENSFAAGSNVMAAASEDKTLGFKNLCGYLVLKFYGEDVQIGGLSVRSNAGELLAGTGLVAIAPGEDPTLTLLGGGATQVDLTFGKSVALAASEDDATAFWIVLAPGMYAEGLTVTVTDGDGKVLLDKETRPLEIVRNEVYRLSPLRLGHTKVEPEWIELAPGFFWADINVGAGTPGDEGDFFAWGETEPKETYSWDNYKWGTLNAITKYNGKDGLSMLEAADDAASVNWSEFADCHIPTRAQLMWLRLNCDWTWQDEARDEEGNILQPSGMTVTSRERGYEKNGIFLPASGYYDGSALQQAGSVGFIWSSNYGFAAENAWYLYFYDPIPQVYTDCRYMGYPVRPVKRVPLESVSIEEKIAIKLVPGPGTPLTLTISPVYASVPAAVWTSADERVVTVNANGELTPVAPGVTTVTVQVGGKTASCTVTVYEPTIDGSPYVEMGDGLKWAKMNVGATSPEQAGNYYAWGETVHKRSCYLDDYQFYDERSRSFTKYNGRDQLLTLEAEDDAATVNWSDKWRMPTASEMATLCDKSKFTWTWTKDYEGTGVAGSIVISKIPGYEGNTIFLPATGHRDESTIVDEDFGEYWTASLDVSAQSCEAAVICKVNGDQPKTGSSPRYLGLPVRPVSATAE